MTHSDTTTAEHQSPRRLKPGKVVVFTLLFGLGILLLAGWHYRVHLLWRYKARDAGLGDVRAIPDRPMPESPIPDDWVRCRVGRIEFRLPPELAGEGPVKESSSLVAFVGGSRRAIVAVPTDENEFDDLLATASKLSPDNERFTMPGFRRACYQADSDDFRWSMKAKEVRWHSFRISMTKLIRRYHTGHTESLLGEDMDILLHLDGRRAVVWWQSNNPRLGGFIHLIDSGDEEFDPAWMRRVCRSVRVVEEGKGSSARE